MCVCCVCVCVCVCACVCVHMWCSPFSLGLPAPSLVLVAFSPPDTVFAAPTSPPSSSTDAPSPLPADNGNMQRHMVPQLVRLMKSVQLVHIFSGVLHLLHETPRSVHKTSFRMHRQFELNCGYGNVCFGSVRQSCAPEFRAPAMVKASHIWHVAGAHPTAYTVNG